MASNRFVVTSHNPLRRGVLVLGAAATLAVVGVVAYFVGGGEFATDLDRLRADFGLISERNVKLTRENSRLREELTFAARAAQVSERAVRHVQTTLGEQRARISELEDSVAFYRGILKPESTGKPFAIHSLQLRPVDANGRRFAFALVLTQVLKSDKVLEGTVALSVDGKSGGGSVREATGVRRAAAVSVAFRFRYFQKLEGELTLPPDFQPQRVMVEAVVKSKGREIGVRREFAWGEGTPKRPERNS